MIAAAVSLILLAQVGEEKGIYTITVNGRAAGAESFSFEEFEERRLAFHSTLRRGEFKSDAVLTLDAGDLRPVLYAAVHRKGREEREIRLEWKDGKVRGIPFPRDGAVLDAGLPTQILPVLRRAVAGRLKAFDPSSLSFRDLEIVEKGERIFCGKERQLRARHRRVTFGESTLEIYGDAIPLLMETGETRWVLRGCEDFAEDPGAVVESREKYGIWTRPAKRAPGGAVLLVSNSPDLALRLAAEGIGALRFDDRGKTLTDSVGLALEAIRDLRGRDGVDPVRIAVLGRGEGGILASIVAEKDSRVRGLILLSSPGKPWSDVILDRVDAELRSGGTGAEQRKQILEAQRAEMRRIRESTEDELEIDGRRTFVGRLRELYRIDPVEPLRRVGAPVVVAQEMKDEVVFPENADILEAVLKGREGCEVRRFADRGDPALLKFLAESAARVLK